MKTDRKYAHGHYLSVFTNELYSKTSKDLKIGKHRLEVTIKKYSREGHNVKNKTGEWSVYVIDLCQDHLKKEPKFGHVNAGPTIQCPIFPTIRIELVQN